MIQQLIFNSQSQSDSSHSHSNNQNQHQHITTIQNKLQQQLQQFSKQFPAYAITKILHETEKSYIMLVEIEMQGGCVERVLKVCVWEEMVDRQRGVFLRLVDCVDWGDCHIVECMAYGGKWMLFGYYGKNLGKVIGDYGIYDVQIIYRLLKHMLKALGFMHKNGYIHGDIKPANILYKQDKFYLCDLGNSLSITECASTQQKLTISQSAGYIAPQWFNTTSKEERINEKIDIWGLGCVLFEVMTAQNLIPIPQYQCNQQNYYQMVPSLIKSYTKQKKVKQRLSRQTSKSNIEMFEQILLSMIQIQPSKRPSILQLQQRVNKLL